MSFEIEYKNIALDDLNLCYRVFGDDKATQKMLILHGWNTVGSQSWEDFIRLFQEKINTGKLQIIAPDMPGFAKSDVPKSIWQAEDYAIFLSKFITKLGLSDIVLVGHSFGGAISSIIVSQNQLSIKHLFLVAPAIVRNWGENQSIKQKITKIGKKIFKLPLLSFCFNLSRKIWYRLLRSPDYIKTTGIMSEIMSEVVKHDVQYVLKNIVVPTTLIWGKDDKMTPFSQAYLVQKQIRNSQLISLDGVNHGIHLNASDRLFEIISTSLTNTTN